MAIWLPYKAPPHERQKTQKKPRQRLRYCRICGKQVNGGGTICPSCSQFIKQKQNEERRAKK